MLDPHVASITVPWSWCATIPSVAWRGAVYAIIDVQTRDMLSCHRTRQAPIDTWREQHTRLERSKSGGALWPVARPSSSRACGTRLIAPTDWRTNIRTPIPVTGRDRRIGRRFRPGDLLTISVSAISANGSGPSPSPSQSEASCTAIEASQWFGGPTSEKVTTKATPLPVRASMTSMVAL